MKSLMLAPEDGLGELCASSNIAVVSGTRNIKYQILVTIFSNLLFQRLSSNNISDNILVDELSSCFIFQIC